VDLADLVSTEVLAQIRSDLESEDLRMRASPEVPGSCLRLCRASDASLGCERHHVVGAGGPAPTALWER
jgi:hypothetical protein